MTQKSKPLVIINCARGKANVASKPIDLYNDKNSLATIVRSKEDILDSFTHNVLVGRRTGYVPPRFSEIADVYVLSAEHGLVNAFGREIEPYDNELSEVDCENEGFVNEFQSKTRKILNELDISTRTVYVCMSAKYRRALFNMAGNELEAVKDLYVADGMNGIGDLRGRINRVCYKIAYDYMAQSEHYNVGPVIPTIFRSGNSSVQEIGIYHSNRNFIGTSLYYINSSKPSAHQQGLVDIAQSTHRNNKVFVDNGYISSKDINPDWVFAEYKLLLKKTWPSCHQNLTFVIPDSLDPDGALEIIRKHKADIQELLSHYVRLVLPVHNWGTSPTVRKIVKSIFKELNWSKGIVAGVLCLKERELKFCQLQAILSLKSPDGEQLFSGVHFLGLGDSYRKEKAFKRRLTIATLFGFTDISYDSNRTNALFGSKEKNKRQCTKLENILDKELLVPTTLREVFTTPITMDYEKKIVKDFYYEGITKGNFTIAFDILNRSLPEKFRIRLYEVELKNQRYEFVRKCRTLSSRVWDSIHQNVLEALYKKKLVAYNATDHFNYYEKRKLAYGQHLKTTA